MSTMPGKEWNIRNSPKFAERRQFILRSLERGSKRFNQLWKEMKKRRFGKVTLSLLLKSLMEDEAVKLVPKGRVQVYELNEESEYVQEMLGWKTEHGTVVRIERYTNLNRLNEGKFIANWLNSIKFAFLNIVQDYMVLGKGTKELRRRGNGATQPIERFLEAHLSDMVDIAQLYGEILAERIQREELDPKKVWNIRNKVLKELKAEMKEEVARIS